MSRTDLRVAFREDPHSPSETHASPSGGVDYTVCGKIGDKTGNSTASNSFGNDNH